MDAAYALMVRTYAGIPGKNLIEAIELTNESFGLSLSENGSVEAQNEASLQQLQQMMRGVR